MSDRLMLLDTAGIYFRAFYGVPDTVRAPDGTVVNAVRGTLDFLGRDFDLIRSDVRFLGGPEVDPLLDVVGTGPRGRAGEFADAMRLIAEEERGVVVLLRDLEMKIVHEGEVSPQTLRQYGLGAQILSSLGLSRLELLTNSGTPKVVGLDAYGLEITGTRKITRGA